MIIDSLLKYSASQVITSSGASTNILDHGADRDLGKGEAMALVINVEAIDASSSDETYAAQLQADDNSGFSSPGSVGDSISIPRGTAVGTKFVRALPPDTSMERYSRVNFTLGGTTPSITVTAFLQPMRMLQTDGVYPSGFVVA